jgi:glycosyltransferase involved in cell wall biosynthesis
MCPKISVILPVYNGQAWVGSCIRSALSQTLRDFELVVGDDGSTDGSRSIIAGFDYDSRLRLFPFDRNVGLFGNLNRLLENARAPIVRFLCQDDLLEPQCLAEDVAYFESQPDVVMSMCSVRVIDAEDRVLDEWDTISAVISPSLCLQHLFFYGCVAGNLSTVSAQRAAIERAGLFDDSFQLAGDYEMWVRLGQLGNVAYRREKLIRIREHTGRLSKSAHSGVQFVDENRRIRSHILTLLPEQIQKDAVGYAYWRQNVLDTHHFLRCLTAGRFGDCSSLLRIMGFRDLAAGFALWFLTMNNHLYRPTPVFRKT